MSIPNFNAPSTNPFGLTDVGFYSSPTFVDIDGDGDLDALIGEQQGNTIFYRNTGSASAPAFASSSANPFSLTKVDNYSNPTLVDIDGDGDLDAFIGRGDGNTIFYRNTGSASAPAFASSSANPFGLTNVGGRSNPTFVDIDGDGDLDAFIGALNGTTIFYRNTGSASAPAFASSSANPFGLTSVTLRSNPTFVDIDGDGDLDAFIGDTYGSTFFQENTGSASAPAFASRSTNPFGLTNVGSRSNPTFVDIDGDGDLDALIGNVDGNTLFYRNRGSITLTQSGGNTAVTEGGTTDSYTIVLTSRPTATVTVTLTPNSQVTTSVASLTFTTANWNVPQTVTVTAVNDAIAEGTHTGSITHTVTSSDVDYNGMAIATVTATITDNDTAGITITQSGGNTAVTEGSTTDSYTLVLTSQPTATVTVSLTPDSQVTTSASSLTFTTANWNVPQAITVTAVDDGVIEGTHTGSISHTATSSDPKYNGIAIATVNPTVTDNDTAGVTITQSGGNTTVTEGGTTDSYTVVLKAQPKDPVVINLTPNNQVTTSVSSLAFYPETWNIPQTITVTAIDDAIIEGTHTGSITHTVATSDPYYQGIAIATVTATITDNDKAGITITQSGGNTTVTEGGTTDSYTITLSALPNATVTVTLTPDNQVTTSVSSLTFTTANWNVPQTVTVTAVNDTVGEGTHRGAITHKLTSTDFRYNNITQSFVVSVTDNDLPLGIPNFATPSTNPFGLANTFDIGGGYYSSPTFVDIDGDGDLDAFVGDYNGGTWFYRNTGSASTPAFATPDSSFIIAGLGFYSNPTFADIDGDGDLDAFNGAWSGGTLFFENTGSASAPAFADLSPNPFGLGNVGYQTNPTLVDIDGDGDLDVLIGDAFGNIVFFQNTGSASAPAFASSSANPFGLGNVGFRSSPTFVDIDGDGDLDAFIGEEYGHTVVYQNTGSANTPAFALAGADLFGLTDVGNRSNPAFADIDADGDLDAFIGNRDGNTLFYLNQQAAPIAPTLSLDNTTLSLAENTNTASPIKVADITITNAGSGTNTLSLSGADAIAFEISGTALYLKAGTSLNYEAQNSYSVTVNLDNSAVSGSPDATTAYTLTVTDINETPTSLTLSNNTINENSLSGTVVGTLSTTDPDLGDTFTYQFKTGAGVLTDTINPFTLVGNSLQVKGLVDFEAKSKYSLTVRTTDAAGAFFEKTFAINILDLTTNTIVGTAAAESFVASNELDNIQAMDGNDTVTVAVANLQSGDRIEGGIGSDTLVFTGGTASQQLTLSLTNSSNQFGGLTGTPLSSVVIKTFDNVTLTNFGGAAQVTGTGIVNKLTGGAGNDTLSGLGGSDILTGNAGSDVLTGGLGDDVLYLGTSDGAVDQVIYSSGDGLDKVYQFVRGAGGDQLRFTGITSIDVRTVNSNTEFRVGDGIAGNAGFGTGTLLLKTMATTGFVAGDEGVNLFNLTTPSGGLLFS